MQNPYRCPCFLHCCDKAFIPAIKGRNQKGLHGIDEGCPHMHFTHLPPVLQILDSDSDSDCQLDSKHDPNATDSQMSSSHHKPFDSVASDPDQSGSGEFTSDTDESVSDEPPLPRHKLLGHPLPCSVAHCGSTLFNIAASPVHYLHCYVHSSVMSTLQENTITWCLGLMRH